jgi:predicted small metal-binding protein
MEMPNEETMLFRYSCRDMGLGCGYIVKGETLEEVTKKALEHVREMHKADFNAIETPEEIDRMEKALTRSTRVVAD